MPDHPRKLIRDSVIVLLTGQITYNAQTIIIYQSRILPWFPVELPAIAVYLHEETSEHRDSAPRENYRELQLITEIVAEENNVDGTDDIFDEIGLQIEEKLVLDPYLTNTADDSFYTGMSIRQIKEGNKIISGMSMIWSVEFRKWAPELQALDDLTDAITSIDANADANSRIKAEQTFP